MTNDNNSSFAPKAAEDTLNLFCIINEEGRFTYLSDSCKKILGYNPAELINKHFMDLVVPSDYPTTEKASQRLHSGNDLEYFENHCLHKNGTIVPFKWSAHFNQEEKKLFAFARVASEKNSSDTAIKRKETRFRKLIQNSTDGLALLDVKGKIIEISDPGIGILEYTETEHHSGTRNIKLNVHEEDIYKIDEAFFDILNDPENIKHIQYRIKTTGNEYRWIEATFQNELDEAAVKAIVLNFRDITQRKLSELAVIRSESLRKSIMNSALDAIVCIDSRGSVILWNDQAEKIFGWKKEEVLGNPMLNLIIPPKYRKQHNQGLKNYQETGKGVIINKVIEITAINRNKEEFPVELRVIALKENDEQIFCSFIRDLTERKKAEISLQKSEERYHKMVEEVKDYAIILLDTKGRIQNWNKGAESIKGYKEEEIIGKHFGNFYPEEAQALKVPEKILHEAAEKGVAVSEGYRVRKNGSLFWANTVLTALHNNKGEVIGYTKVTRDLSEKKKAEEELIKYAEELKTSNEELEHFAYIASHDLQEPLRMVTSFLTQLEKKYKGQLDQKAQQYIYFATDGAARMRRIILDLLEYSRIGKKEYDYETVDLNDVLKEVVQFNRTAIKEKNARVIWDELPAINGSRTPIEQVLQNLITNALKYQAPGVEPEVIIRSEEKAREWKISVSDNGIGIEPQFFDKIFVLFQRLHQKEEYSGTGIGLAICKKIVDNFGGKLWVESEPGKGSTFCFTIPKRSAT